jgi:hypothetical protein
MRACIAHRASGVLRRIVWFNESATGIYLGYYGTKMEHHHSIHTDGHRHLRTVDETDLLPRTKGPPIADLRGYVQLLNASIHLPPQETHSSAYSEGEKADVLAIIDAEDNPEPERVSLDYYLIHGSSEDEFIKSLRWPSIPELGPHVLGLCQLVRLENFPDHKVAFAVHRPAKK